MLTDNVVIQAIIVIGSIVTTYLTVKYKDRIIKKDGDSKSDNGEPRTRMDTIFDGYEKLIKQQQEDIIRKQDQLEQTQDLIDRLQEELNETQSIVRKQRDELEEQKRLNIDLEHQLELMREQYDQLKQTNSIK